MDKKSNLQAFGVITLMVVVSLVVARYTLMSAHPQTLPPLRLTEIQPTAKDRSVNISASKHTNGSDGSADSNSELSPPTVGTIGAVMVDISGAVHLPGVYSLKTGSRIVDAIRAAGGSTPDANTDPLNLAELIHDGSKIVVPRNGANVSSNTAKGAINPQHASGITPQIGESPTRHVSPSPTSSTPQSNSTLSQTPETTDPSTSGSVDSSPVNINTAGLEELQRIPGVGPATAQHIIEYRNQAGGFRSIEDLKNVKGIGDKKFAKMAPMITVS